MITQKAAPLDAGKIDTYYTMLPAAKQNKSLICLSWTDEAENTIKRKQTGKE